MGYGFADGFGAEIFSSKVLEELEKSAKTKNEREHLTTFIWNNPNKFTILGLLPSKELNFPNLKFDIDTKEDLDKLSKLIYNGVSINSKASEIIKIAKNINF